MSVLWLASVALLFGPSHSCYQCFIPEQDSGRLCWGHIWSLYNIKNVDSCFRTLDRIFNSNPRVIEAGRVEDGYDAELSKIMNAEIQPLVKLFDKKRNQDTVYEEKLQKAAENFIEAASKLPRVSGCVPPCGFQGVGAVYNCSTCRYDSCQLPLDCPIKEMEIKERSRIQMRCQVLFNLPDGFEVIWRFAEKVKTQEMEEFKEVTAGVDTLYSIPATGSQHEGTYQCEIFSGPRSIVRLYFYITVTPEVAEGYTELQELFDLSMLPGGQLQPDSDDSLSLLSYLLPVCLTASLLMLFLSLRALHWFSVEMYRNPYEDSDEGEHFRLE